MWSIRRRRRKKKRPSVQLIELLLPTAYSDGRPIPAVEFIRLRELLTDRFGGATFFSRAPAEGTWKRDAQPEQHDTIVVMEVMAEAIETVWWRELKVDLERRLSQSSIVIRVSQVDLL